MTTDSRSFMARHGLAVPIIQASMAGYQASALAVGAGSAGALGSLPGASLAPPVLAEEIAAIRAAGQRAVNVNFFVHTPPAPDARAQQVWRDRLRPYYEEFGLDPADVPTGPGRQPFGDEALALIETLRPEVVSFHFGLPRPALFEAVRRTGAQIWSSATTIEEARWLEARGVDVLIAQGTEAGGHRGIFLGNDLAGQPSTLPLLKRILAETRLPVIAAGGLGDADSVANALAQGACAVLIGTAFLLSPEALTNPVHRAALGASGELRTALTNVYTGRPARGIVNRLMRELDFICPVSPAFPSAVNAVAPLRAAAERLGSGDFSPMWAGQGARPQAAPAAEVVAALARKL